MIWVTNEMDPKLPRIYMKITCISTVESAQYHKVWVESHTIGGPQATAVFTVEELKAMGIVGLYRDDVESDENISSPIVDDTQIK